MNQQPTQDHNTPAWTVSTFRSAIPAKHPWVPFLLPLIVFLAVGSLELTRSPDTTLFGLISYRHYPLVYSAKILLTTLALWFVWPAYRVFPFRISPLAIAVGVIGVGVWIGLTKLNPEQWLPLEWLMKNGERSAYNPLHELSQSPVLAYAFLAVRFFGLAVVIAIAEEMFLRGFLIRCVENPDHWEQLPIGQAGWMALIVGTVFPMLTHPGELFAAMAWFSLISWLMLRTRNIWDCIAAHMVTNLLLGIYVMTTGNWQLW